MSTGPGTGWRRCGCGCHDTPPPAPCGCPRQGCPPKPEPCPPPPVPSQPGVVEIPGVTQLPPTITTQPVPPWATGKPPDGDPGRLPWFRGLVNDYGRKGPRFGPRKDEYLPYLLVRTAAGDRGARPINGVHWESPDIFVAPAQEADTAPLLPPTGAGVADAGAPNTLYAHVWNLGKAPAYRVRVEFYWFNPSLGINQSDANLIGAAWIDLANRFTTTSQWLPQTGPDGQDYLSRGSHAIVRCPTTWVPQYLNGGHECLVVRALEPMMDAIAPDQFSSAADRHVAQRNIAVVQAASPASLDLALDLGYPDQPSGADLDVQVDGPAGMEWLRVLTGKANPGLVATTQPINYGFLPPTAPASRRLALSTLSAEARAELLKPRERFERGCCPLRVQFHAGIDDLTGREAAVLRLRQRVDGQVVGGYTVVLLPPATPP
jgi:hypothetical protein